MLISPGSLLLRHDLIAVHIGFKKGMHGDGLLGAVHGEICHGMLTGRDEVSQNECMNDQKVECKKHKASAGREVLYSLSHVSMHSYRKSRAEVPCDKRLAAPRIGPRALRSMRPSFSLQPGLGHLPMSAVESGVQLQMSGKYQDRSLQA